MYWLISRDDNRIRYKKPFIKNLSCSTWPLITLQIHYTFRTVHQTYPYLAYLNAHKTPAFLPLSGEIYRFRSAYQSRFNRLNGEWINKSFINALLIEPKLNRKKNERQKILKEKQEEERIETSVECYYRAALYHCDIAPCGR